MRSLVRVAVLASVAQHATAESYFVFGASDGWDRLMGSVGVRKAEPDHARILVLRSGAAARSAWSDRVRQGTLLVLEGESPAAESFGFRGTKERTRVVNVEDMRNPRLSIIWQSPLELPRFQAPADATIFARDRRSQAPLLAGYRQGAGAVLWLITDPGPNGYERFPYLLHALADLGLEVQFRSSRLWGFFDYSYRTRVDLDYFATRWRKGGIAALHVAAWHFFEPDPERDEYLKRLIRTCHENGILVYAWLELPHVSERFWRDHPGWREKTALLEDAHLDWRKLMNLQNRECFRAAAAGSRDLVRRFDWDGMNLAELYFESLEGAKNPARFTPMNDDVRSEYRRVAGVDPMEVVRRGDSPDLGKFLEFRVGLAKRMQVEWMEEIQSYRSEKPHLDVVLTHVDDRIDPSMRAAIGADAAGVLPLLEQHNFTFLIEDPATVWHLAPQRYPEMARRYKSLTSRREKLAIDINIAERYQNVYPTKQQTGGELLQLVQLASEAFSRVALYFESSLLPPDLPLLAASAATVTVAERDGPRWRIESEQGIRVLWRGPVKVDGQTWPATDGVSVLLPKGPHVLEPGDRDAPVRVLDFNGDLESAEVAAGAVRLRYRSDSRAIALLDRIAARVEVDGAPHQGGGRSLILPRGAHTVLLAVE